MSIKNRIMKMVKLDDNAHEILSHVKEDMKKSGIESPTFSDTIRWITNEKN